MKFSTLTIVLVLLSTYTLWAQNPRVFVNSSGMTIAEYKSNKTIGQKFPVPTSWDIIRIKKGVTVTGSFFADASRGSKNLTVEGDVSSRETCIIKGSGNHTTGGTVEDRQKSNIRYEGSGLLTVRNLTSLNPDKFHIWGKKTVKVYNCRIIDNRGAHTTDGVHGGLNSKSVVQDCYISTHDDALYVSEVYRVIRTTIVHNRNGSPFQVGWGTKDYSSTPQCLIEDCKVISNSTGYNQGVVAWADRKGNKTNNTVRLKFVNFQRTKNSGMNHANMFQFGTPNVNTIVTNASFAINGDDCPNWTDVFNHTGSSGTVKFNCNSNARYGVEETLEQSQQIDIYPNPAQFELNLQGVEEGSKVRFFDITGVKVWETLVTGSKLNISHLSRGLYFVKINDSFNKKVILE